MLELRILNGLHRGAAMPIEDTHILKIGSGEDCDILISDNGIDAHHLTIEHQAEYGLVLNPIGSVRGEDGLAVDQSVILERLHCFSLNGIWIGLAAPEDDWDVFGDLPTSFPELELTNISANEYTPDPIKMSWKSKIFATAGLLMLAGWATASVFMPKQSFKNIDNPVANSSKSMNENQEEASQKQEKKLITKKNYSREEMAAALDVKLMELQLKKFVDVKYSVEGWDIEGNMDDEDRLRLDRAVEAFNAQYKPRFPINVRILSLTNFLPFKINQIITGKLAGVITQDGQRLFIGDTVDGYRLTSVQGNTASFDGKRKIDITL
jgi:type III secretion protein D